MIDGEMIKRLEPDAIILATGAEQSLQGEQKSVPGLRPKGMDQDHVISATQLLSGHHNQIGKSAVVFDDVGGYVAIGAAEYLVEQGTQVTFATSLSSFAPKTEFSLATTPALQRLFAKGNFDLKTRVVLEQVCAESVILGSLYTDQTEDLPAETVVMVTVGRPNNQLLSELDDFEGAVQVVGDARHQDFLPAQFLREIWRVGPYSQTCPTYGVAAFCSAAKSSFNLNFCILVDDIGHSLTNRT